MDVEIQFPHRLVRDEPEIKVDGGAEPNVVLL